MINLSAIQFRPTLAFEPAGVSLNARRSEDLLREASNLGPSLMVLPELSFTGYSFTNRDQAIGVAEKQNGKTFRYISDIAKQLDVYICWGYVEIDGDNLYNSGSMCDNTGKLVLSYRKINLWGTDFLWATPGKEHPKTIETDFGTISIIICRDLRDRIPQNIPRLSSEGKRIFGSKKPNITAAMVNWGKGGFPSTTWMDFAANNKTTLVVANRWGSEKNDSFEQDFGQGGSCIIEKNWRVHTNGLKFSKDCVVSGIVPEESNED